jgi:hypothetical protein
MCLRRYWLRLLNLNRFRYYLRDYLRFRCCRFFYWCWRLDNWLCFCSRSFIYGSRRFDVFSI